jgi:iron complex outermembrane recepter protein
MFCGECPGASVGNWGTTMGTRSTACGTAPGLSPGTKRSLLASTVLFSGLLSAQSALAQSDAETTELDAALSYEWKSMEFQLNASNLFNKEYIASCSSVEAGCYPGEGRKIIGSVKHRW